MVFLQIDQQRIEFAKVTVALGERVVLLRIKYETRQVVGDHVVGQVVLERLLDGVR